MAESVVTQFLKENPEAAQNLTPSELRGYRKLIKRVNNKEIVIYTTNKSSKLAVASLESYQRQGDKHIGDDKELSGKEVKEVQSLTLNLPGEVGLLVFLRDCLWGQEGVSFDHKMIM